MTFHSKPERLGTNGTNTHVLESDSPIASRWAPAHFLDCTIRPSPSSSIFSRRCYCHRSSPSKPGLSDTGLHQIHPDHYIRQTAPGLAGSTAEPAPTAVAPGPPCPTGDRFWLVHSEQGKDMNILNSRATTAVLAFAILSLLVHMVAGS